MTQHTVDDPFTLEPSTTIPVADDRAIGEVLDRARAAAREVRRLSVADRVAIASRALEAFEAELEATATDITRTMGKPLEQARGEVRGTKDRWSHMTAIAEAALADTPLPPKENFERRIAKVPLGVVLDLPAWNYPLLTAVNAVVPAFLAGNAVVIKPSPRSPLSASPFVRAFAKAGAPAHALQEFFTDYETTERVVGDARVDAVLFTGSVLGGHKIEAAAKERFIPVGLELGGNDPAYVAADADLEATVANVVDGAMYNAGQSCCAVERVYVHASLYDRFVEACLPIVAAYVMGDPRDKATTMGPIAQPWHPRELAAFCDDAVRRGARLLAGGKATTVGGKGRFFEPAVLCDVPQEADLMQKESFGPILAVAKVASDEEATARMNDNALGLTASVWTRDRERAERMARELEFGTVYMNRCDALDPALPWSGVKDSGRGVTLSALAYDHLTRPKAIHFRLKL